MSEDETLLVLERQRERREWDEYSRLKEPWWGV
jgi:hypothetical protein